MALNNIERTIILDVYDHDTTPTKIKAIALDSKTRYVLASLRNNGNVYDAGQDTTVTLTIIRPDNTGVQITGETKQIVDLAPEGEVTVYGVYAELTQTALAVKGTLRAQFMLTSGEQVLRTEIFAINCGEALDASTDTWAGEYQGYNLDELVQNVNSAVATVEGMEEDVSELKSGLTNIESMSPMAVFDQTVSGTQMKTVSGLSIPAREYDITVDSIVSSDTDTEICSVAFISNGTTNKTINFPRGNNISRDVTFTADIDTIIFYASSSWPSGSGDTFTFTGFKLSRDTALVAKINSIDSNIDALNNNLELYAGVMYEKNAKISYTEGANYKLADTGFSVYDANYTLKKFHVDPGALYMIHSDHAFQFQSAERVPVSGTSNRVGQTYGIGDFFVQVPVGAPYLIVSTTKSNSSISVMLYENLIDKRAEFFANGNSDLYTNIAQGGYTNAGVLNSIANRIRIDACTAVGKYGYIDINAGTLQYYYTVWRGTLDLNHLVEYSADWASGKKRIQITDDGYFMVAFRRANNENLTPDDFDGQIIIHDTTVAKNENRLNALDLSTEIPDYYFENDYLPGKTARIAELVSECAATGDAFVFITDEHWALNTKKSPSLIKYITDRVHIPLLINGGDTDDNVSNAFMDSLRKSFKWRIHSAAGNHDWFNPDDGNSIYYAFDMYNANQIGNEYEHYYYVDNPQKKIRYVYLNAFIRESGSTTVTNGYNEGQVMWFAQHALGVPAADWDIIVITHYIGTTASPYGTGGESIRNAIDTYNADSSHTGKVIAIVQGHGHYDTVYHTAGGVPIITTTCDKNGAWISSGTDQEPWLTRDRVTGTTAEQAFDVMVVDRIQKKITAVRIGCKAMDNTDLHIFDTGFDDTAKLEERVISYGS